MPGFFLIFTSMCGIAGIISLNDKNVQEPLLKHICKVLAHRGPNGQSVWINHNNLVGFAHTRLSIIDLSIQASQPMHYLDRYTIVFNGEIYNYLELKEQLVGLGYHFFSQSDTEVILAAYDYWADECLERLDGMFAFAIYDSDTETLFAARDRFGEKPFYYFLDDGSFVFASEMKALWAAGIEKKTDPKMLLNFLTLGYVQNPNNKERTFFENISSLAPGTYLLMDVLTLNYKKYHYWDIDKESQKTYSIQSASNRLADLLYRSVKLRLRSDVSIGTSLSGGIDSSTIAAFIHQLQQAPDNFQTFTAVFPGFDRDESRYSSEVCSHFHLQNHTVTPTVEGFLEDFDRLCYHQEEPFTSTSIYAQYKVFQLAKEKGISVLLDGQGADETLAGYNRYIHWYLQQLIAKGSVIKALKEKNKLVHNQFGFKWGAQNYIAALFPANVALKLERNEYRRTLNHPDINPDFALNLRGREWEGIHKPIITKLNDILYFNSHNLGLEELLRFADRNSMAHGREARLPFLNHELVQFIFSLPAHFKIHDGWTKWILRHTMKDQLPESIVWRKDKVGYEPPQLQWMQNAQLQERIQEAKRKLVNNGVLSSHVLNRPVQPMAVHDAGNFDWRYLSAAQAL